MVENDIEMKCKHGWSQQKMLKVNFSMLRGSQKAKGSLINKQVVMNVKLDNRVKTRAFALYV